MQGLSRDVYGEIIGTKTGGGTLITIQKTTAGRLHSVHRIIYRLHGLLLTYNTWGNYEDYTGRLHNNLKNYTGMYKKYLGTSYQTDQVTR